MHAENLNPLELNEKTMSWLKDLARKERESIGFIPISYYQTSWLRRRLLLSVANGEPTGFLHWGHLRKSQKKTIHVNQICVQRDARRFAHASQLMCELIDMRENRQADLVHLKCAVELESNLFWRACGGEVIDIHWPQNSRKRPINVWRIPIPEHCRFAPAVGEFFGVEDVM